MSDSPSICIIGGGAAGLSAAWYLRDRGYRNVVVLEKADHVGGKCHSFSHQGRSYDLGAFTVTPSYAKVIELAFAVGAPMVQQPRRRGFLWNNGHPQVQSLLKTILSDRDETLLALGLAGGRYLMKLAQYESVLGKPGFAGCSLSGRFPELSQPFGEWAKANGATPLVEVFTLPVNDMGYGDVSHVPAAYVLKYMNSINAATLGVYALRPTIGWPKRFKDGFQRLWERVSWRLDVRLNARVESVTRGRSVLVKWTELEGGVTRERDGEFDHLIIACPPDPATLHFMDLTDEERGLLSQIECLQYWVTACESAGMPTEILDGFHDDQHAGAMEIMHAWGNSDVATFYTPGPATPTEVLDRIRVDVAALFPAARVGRVLRQIPWQYFPHVKQPALAGGFYDRLEALQGKNRTFFTGSALAFETVENAVEYSAALVDRSFPVQATGMAA